MICAPRAPAIITADSPTPPQPCTTTLDLRSDLGDHAGELVARDVGGSDVRVVPHPPVPVASARAGGRDLNDNAGFRTSGVIHLGYGGQLLESLVEHRTHGKSSRQVCRGVMDLPATDNLHGRTMTKPPGSSL